MVMLDWVGLLARDLAAPLRGYRLVGLQIPAEMDGNGFAPLPAPTETAA